MQATRGFLWSDAETRTLLKIWGEQGVQAALDGNFRNSFVYREVARRLGEMGFERTPEQCRVRVKSIKRQYLLAKEGNLRNSGQYHKICKFYDAMERILSNRPGRNRLEMMDRGGPAAGDDTPDSMATEEDGEDTELAQGAYPEITGECSYPETEVKLEYPPIPAPVTVTLVGSNSPAARQSSSGQPASDPLSYPTSNRPRRPRKRHSSLPLEKLLESFLQQSARAEENFRQLEERRLQAEDRRCETEHARELHMLQMLGQMFSGVAAAAARNPATASDSAGAHKRPAAFYAPVTPPGAPSLPRPLTHGRTGHDQDRSPEPDCFSQQSQLSHTEPQSLGSGFSVSENTQMRPV